MVLISQWCSSFYTVTHQMIIMISVNCLNKLMEIMSTKYSLMSREVPYSIPHSIPYQMITTLPNDHHLTKWSLPYQMIITLPNDHYLTKWSLLELTSVPNMAGSIWTVLIFLYSKMWDRAFAATWWSAQESWVKPIAQSWSSCFQSLCPKVLSTDGSQSLTISSLPAVSADFLSSLGVFSCWEFSESRLPENLPRVSERPKVHSSIFPFWLVWTFIFMPLIRFYGRGRFQLCLPKKATSAAPKIVCLFSFEPPALAKFFLTELPVRLDVPPLKTLWQSTIVLTYCHSECSLSVACLP